MSLFGSGFASLVDRIIGLGSQPITLTRRSGGVYNPVTGVPVTATSLLVKGSIVPYESFRHSGFRKEIGLDVQEGDLIAILSAYAASGLPLAPPHPNDLIETPTVVYTIVGVAPHAPAGVDLMFLCAIRGGQ